MTVSNCLAAKNIKESSFSQFLYDSLAFSVPMHPASSASASSEAQDRGANVGISNPVNGDECLTTEEESILTEIGTLDFYVHQYILNRMKLIESCLYSSARFDEETERRLMLQGQHYAFLIQNVISYLKDEFKMDELPIDRLLRLRLDAAKFMTLFFFHRDGECLKQHSAFEQEERKEGKIGANASSMGVGISIRNCCLEHQRQGYEWAYQTFLDAISVNSMNPISVSVLLLDYRTQLALMYGQDAALFTAASERYLNESSREFSTLHPINVLAKSIKHQGDQHLFIDHYRTQLAKRHAEFIKVGKIKNMSEFHVHLAKLKKTFPIAIFETNIFNFLKTLYGWMEKPLLSSFSAILALNGVEEQKRRLSGQDFRTLVSNHVMAGTHPDVEAFLQKVKAGCLQENEKAPAHDSGLDFESDVNAESVAGSRSPLLEPVVLEEAVTEHLRESRVEADGVSDDGLLLPDYVSRFETQEPLELVEERIAPIYASSPAVSQNPEPIHKRRRLDERHATAKAIAWSESDDDQEPRFTRNRTQEQRTAQAKLNARVGTLEDLHGSPKPLKVLTATTADGHRGEDSTSAAVLEQDLAPVGDVATPKTRGSRVPDSPSHLGCGDSARSRRKPSPRRSSTTTSVGDSGRRVGRKFFSPAEIESLKDGYKRYGTQWAVILSKYPFDRQRRPVDLKDKVRNLKSRGALE